MQLTSKAVTLLPCCSCNRCAATASSRLKAWCIICHSHRKTSPSAPSFPLPPLFFPSQSFFQHPLWVCDRFQTGREGENNVLWPSVPPSSSVPDSSSFSQQAVVYVGGGGAWPPPLCRPLASTHQPPPESIAARGDTNDPPKSMHHSTVHHQRWPAVWPRTGGGELKESFTGVRCLDHFSNKLYHLIKGYCF